MKPFLTNDRKAPRMKKGKYSTRVITKELWKEFINSNKDYADMKWQEFTKLWENIAETARMESVQNPLGVKLGSYTGEIKFQYLPTTKLQQPDPKATEELGYVVKELNILSKGKIGKTIWERRWAVKFNKMLQFFAYEPDRRIEELAKKYLEEHPDSIRIARNTLGGHSVWRQLKPKAK